MKKKGEKIKESKEISYVPQDKKINEKEKQIVKKWLPILLKEDAAFREEVMTHFSGIVATKDDIAKILAKLEEHSKILQEHSKILQEHSKILQEHSKVLQEHSKRIDKFDRTLSAIGSRWGILAESSFREGIKGIIEDLGFSVKKWKIRDEEGMVFGKPSMIESDILVKDNIHMLIEIKSSVSKFDVSGFNKIGKLYEQTNKIKPKLIIISPFVDPNAKALSEELGIEIYTSPEEVLGYI